MRDCSKIIVERGGNLIISGSKIGQCSWEGIEVHGNYDACGDDTYNHGELTMTESTITNANIGVFAGKRSGLAHDREYSGGILTINGCTFENNSVDIMFSEWSFVGICVCGDDDGKKWQSSITGNTFNALADVPFCTEDASAFGDNYVDHMLEYYQWFYNNYSAEYPLLQPVPDRCHIIDLSPFVDVWLYELQCDPLLDCPEFCPRAAWFSGVSGCITGSNTYSEPCMNFFPSTQYH
jgi:hypothetical protein